MCDLCDGKVVARVGDLSVCEDYAKEFESQGYVAVRTFTDAYREYLIHGDY